MIIILTIKALGEHREYINEVTKWLCDEFGDGNHYNFFESIIKHSLIKGKLPCTFIGLIGEELVGTVGLWRGDLLSRQDLSPWLSALVVKENHRGKGIGKELQNFLVKYCGDEGFSEIFLYTDLCNYYEKNGWKYIEDGVEFSGKSMKIYKKDL